MKRAILEAMTDDHLEQPSRVIAQHLAEWESPYVDLAIFGTAEPMAIARAIDALCREQMRAGVAEYLFCQSSIGSVHAVLLDDGRRVVVKAHQPDKSLVVLREVARTQMYLAARSLFAPPVLAGPVPLGRGHATIEAFVDVGATADAHRPEIRSALAHSLYAIADACQPLVGTSELAPHILSTMPKEQLWPRPHSKLFNFDGTVGGAAYIDNLARTARAMMDPVGELLIGHGDWRAEHVRFVETRPVAAFDWDSLCVIREPFMVGFAAHAFCADWSIDSRAQAPTLDEARFFVSAYEEARGRAFGRAERDGCRAAFVFSCAYTARCGHALVQDQRAVPGTFQNLVAQVADRLFEL